MALLKILRVNVDDYLFLREENPSTEELPTLMLDLSAHEYVSNIGWAFKQVDKGEIDISLGSFTRKLNFPGEKLLFVWFNSKSISISVEYEWNGRYLGRIPPFLSKISWNFYGDILKVLRRKTVLKPIYKNGFTGFKPLFRGRTILAKEIRKRLSLKEWIDKLLDGVFIRKSLQNWL